MGTVRQLSETDTLFIAGESRKPAISQRIRCPRFPGHAYIQLTGQATGCERFLVVGGPREDASARFEPYEAALEAQHWSVHRAAQLVGSAPSHHVDDPAGDQVVPVNQNEPAGAWIVADRVEGQHGARAQDNLGDRVPVRRLGRVAVQGIGIDDAVHVLHAVKRQGNNALTAVLRHTGRALLLTSLTTGIAFGAIAGSSHRGMAGMGWLLVLGVAAIIRPLPVRNSTVVSEIPFSLSAALLLGFLANAHLFSDYPELSISQMDGAILLFFFCLFMLYVYKTSTVNAPPVPQVASDGTRLRAFGLIALGALGLYFGGQWVVDGAIGLARYWGLNEALIGLTIVAFGTSLPELATSVVAAMRGEMDISIGNLVGSNVFNIMSVLGIASLVRPIPIPGGFFESGLWIDYIVMIFVSFLPWLMMRKDFTVNRGNGVVLLACYVGYLVYLIAKA